MAMAKTREEDRMNRMKREDEIEDTLLQNIMNKGEDELKEKESTDEEVEKSIPSPMRQ